MRVRAAPFGAAGPLLAVGACAIAVFVVWAAKDAGFAVTTWYPGALFLLVLCATVLFAYAPARRAVPRSTAIAIASFAAFALWCAASIAWSDAQGIAWDGANRTFLYLVVYALFALVPWPRAGIGILLCSFSAAVATIGLVEVGRAAFEQDPTHFFIFGRLAAPAGYPNAACALYVFAAWPAAYAAARREVPPVLRGVVMAITVVLADLAVLTESRASLVAVPVALVVYVALVPARVRALLPVLVVGVTIAATRSWLLAPYDPLTHRVDAATELHNAFKAIAFGAAAVAVLWTGFAFLDRRVHVRERFARAVGIALLALAACAAVVAGVVFLTKSPGARIENAWHDFRSGYPAATSSSSHFSSGLGNNRYDFWRVALDEFRDHPVAGVGVDNFAEDYLAARRSSEEPLFPHSVALRVLAQTGIVGTLLFAAFLVSAAIAASAPFRSRDLQAGLARAGVAATCYWAIHGSIDWFWEFPGLTAPALAWLGLAASWRRGGGTNPARRSSWLRLVAVTAGAVVVAALAASFVLPWWSAELQQRAARTWRSSPAAAFRDLDRARGLNPLSPDPRLLEGAIASRLNDLGRMRSAYKHALTLDDRLWYAHFELALAEVAAGRRREALVELERARRLDPREPSIREVRSLVRSGKPVDRAAIDRLFVERVRGRIGP